MQPSETVRLHANRFGDAIAAAASKAMNTAALASKKDWLARMDRQLPGSGRFSRHKDKARGRKFVVVYKVRIDGTRCTLWAVPPGTYLLERGAAKHRIETRWGRAPAGRRKAKVRTLVHPGMKRHPWFQSAKGEAHYRFKRELDAEMTKVMAKVVRGGR